MGLRIGIDLDGVVADFNAGWIRRYNQDFGTDLSLDAVQMWDGLHELTHFPNMGEFWRWARDHGQGSLFRHLEPYEGAVEALGELGRRDHRVIILTSKPGWAVHDTYAWLAEHRIPTREVHVLDDKWAVDCDVYLEDAPHQLVELRHARPEATVVRFVRPWNDPLPGVEDVRSWGEFLELVDRLAVRAERP